MAMALLWISALQGREAFSVSESGGTLTFDFFDRQCLRLRSHVPAGMESRVNLNKVDQVSENEVLIHLTGDNRDVHHGDKLQGGLLGERLRFVSKDMHDRNGHKEMVLTHKDAVTGLVVLSHYVFSASSPTIRRYTEVINQGNSDIGIDYVSSAVMNNLNNFSQGGVNENLRFHIPYNSWCKEAQWHEFKPRDLGFDDDATFNLNAISFTNIGTWSTVKYLPTGMIENRAAGVTWYWQIEHNAAWHWEFSNTGSWVRPFSTYLYLGGPDAYHHNAWKNLSPGQTYTTVPVAIGCVKGGVEEAVTALTQYRREFLLHKTPDHTTCGVVFNDYMNCLWGDPSTAKELPMIEAAAKAGCKYYVIDGGWFDKLGVWEPSKTRFPEGLKFLMDKIREKGMTPGLWFEIEVAGANSALKDKPDEWFFMRHGKRVIDENRYFLDFRNPEVIAYCNEAIDRMISHYGIGYIKIDFNATALTGTDANAESVGQGLLEHNRAVLAWYDTVQQRHPGLIMENCASGGLRTDYAMNSRLQLQSVSDQGDYRKMPAVMVGTIAAVLPEQLGVWSYPKAAGNAREASFNMVSGMMARMFLSGPIDKLSGESSAQITEGIRVYSRTLAPLMHQAFPFFPLGFPSVSDVTTPISLGLRCGDREFIAVWRLQGANKVRIARDAIQSVELIYPRDLNITVVRQPVGFEIQFPDVYMAGIVEITKSSK